VPAIHHVLSPVLVVILMAGNTGFLRGQISDDRIELLTQKAQAAQRSENTEEAIKAYEEILRIRPHWAPAELNLGLMYHLEKRYPDAIRILSEALRHDSSLTPAYLFLGIAYFNTGVYEKALSSLQQFLRLQPADGEVRFFLAGTYLALEDHRNASLLYLEQMKIAPQNEELYYRLGECYLALARLEIERLNGTAGGEYYLRLISAEAHARQKDDSVAEQRLLEALRSNPSAPEAYVSLGQLFLQGASLAAARTKFEEALKRHPKDCRALEGLADTNMAMGNMEAALEFIEQVLTLQPCLEDAPPENLGLPPAELDLRIKLLDEYANLPKWKDAAKYQLRRLRGVMAEPSISASNSTSKTDGGTSPRGLAAPARIGATSSELLVRANRLETEGDLSGATQALLHIESRAAFDPRTAYWAARLYTRLSQKALVRLMSLAPNSHLLAMMRAQMLEQQGDDQQAEAEYRIALTLAEHATDPLIEYARMKCKQNLFQDALPFLERALKLDPYNVRANALLGEVHHLGDKPQAAIPYLQVAVKARPQDEQSRIYLAHSLAKLGQIGEAIGILEAAPSDSDGRVHYALGTYYRRQGRSEDAARAFQVFEQRRNKSKSSPKTGP
jgi:tetratricopeptide (TPR) repeat protein